MLMTTRLLFGSIGGWLRTRCQVVYATGCSDTADHLHPDHDGSAAISLMGVWFLAPVRVPHVDVTVCGSISAVAMRGLAGRRQYHDWLTECHREP
jgi:hypothetical protein